MLGRAVGVALCALAIAISGCGSKKGSEPEASRVAPKATIQAGTWAGKKGAAEVTVSLSKDGRFQTVFRGGSYRSVVKGTATISESLILLEAKELDGKPAKNPADLKTTKLHFNAEWSILTTEDGIALKRKI